MRLPMKRRQSVGLLMAMVLLASAHAASADPQTAEHEVVDARLEGYSKNVTLNGGTALVWMLFIFLGAICVIGFFKDAKRSHLD